MNFKCQQEAINQLKLLSDSDRHSILIEGAQGCGKSYLVKQYANMLNISDVQFVSPTVQSMKDSIDECLKASNKIVLGVENIDTGVLASAYTLLKFLEEPTENVYIVVTCRNLNRVPDTIISRSSVINVSPPINIDINLYAESKNANKFFQLKGTKLWNCIKSFNDVDTIFKLSDSQINYILNLTNLLGFRDTVTNIVWKLSHYEDGSELPVILAIQYIISITNSNHVRQSGMECIKDLQFGRLGNQAVLSRFAFECKYCE